MAFNKLRRAIEQELSASYETPARKIAEQAHLLTRALMALGGKVGEERPPEVTDPSAPHVPTEAEMADIGRPADPDEVGTSIAHPQP